MAAVITKTIQITDPTNADDITKNYAKGSEWTNTLSGEKWILVDNSIGAAVWGGLSSSVKLMADTPPSNPDNGQEWQDTTTGLDYTWYEDGDSGQWVLQQQGGGIPAPTKVVADTPPLSPVQGQEWYDSSTGFDYTFIDDGTSQQWVAITSQNDGGISEAPNDGSQYARKDGDWELVQSDVVNDSTPQLGGNLDAQSTYRINNLVDPAVAQDAATMNYVDTVAGSSGLPSGTVLGFFQAAAPSGWVQNTAASINDRMMRVVNTAGGGTAGSDSPIVNNIIPRHNHSGTASSGGSHTHTIDRIADSGSEQDPGIPQSPSNAIGTWSGVVNASGSSHTHSLSINNTGTSGGWTPRYLNMIICVKS